MPQNGAKLVMKERSYLCGLYKIMVEYPNQVSMKIEEISTHDIPELTVLTQFSPLCKCGRPRP